MFVMSGRGEAIAGMAIADSCTGEGPYAVTGNICWINDTSAVAAGKQIYVNSLNASAIPSPSPRAAMVQGKGPTDNDLGLYYQAAGQNVGYGAVGLGFERTLRVSDGVSVELDAGISALGNVSASDAGSVDTDQVIKNAGGRLRLDFGPEFGVYSGYRWNEGKGDRDSWDRLSGRLQGRSFAASSDLAAGHVQTRGVEYGVSLRPTRKFGMSMGYIPKFRADYGEIGVTSEAAYTGELRFGTGRGALRLRGIRSTDGYWLADLGITIR
jgi:hypothetical protein